jgi:molybdate transport system ATP-binding protein
MPDPAGLVVEIAQDAPFPLDAAFTCAPAHVLAIFGPSGSGKTTILRSVAGLHRPARARIACDDDVWTDTESRRHLPTRLRRVGFVFQEHALFPHLTARGNVLAALTEQPASERQNIADRWLSATHLSGLESRRPAALSGGERQRVALARALARGPRVLLLDEPFAAVDGPLRHKLHEELAEIRRRVHMPIVLVTHDVNDVVRLATHVLLLDRGRAVASGPIAALTSRPDVPWSRHGLDAGSVLDARVQHVDAGRGLAELATSAGTLIVPSGHLVGGTAVRVRVPAREIILATTRPEGLSLHNILAATVSQVAVSADHVFVQLAVGDAKLLTEVTRDAVDRLHIADGRPLFALIKSVSIEVHGV